jgi:ATP-binding cassette subfamily B protein
VALGGRWYGRVIRRLSERVQDALAEAAEVAEETLVGVRTVRAFTREQKEIGRYSSAVDASYELAAKRAFAVGTFQGGMGFAGYSAIALVVWYGGSLVSADAMTMGELTAFLLYTVMVAVSLGALAGLWGDFMRAVGASKRVFELLDRESSLEAEGEPLVFEEGGTIRFDDVCFSYPSRPEVEVMSNFNLTMPSGCSTALVGPSGGGKSTVTSLLLRFYEIQSGEILLDGESISRWDPRSLRSYFATVAQEPTLFACSIAENIRYAKLDATDDEVIEAAMAANAHRFIKDFPDGYETLVGERGIRLSGGQKQRIAIARAVLKNPRFLILDEATSALDAESEYLVQEALERLMEGRTTLVIAHRLSTVRGADKVVVIDQGKVVEEGTHRTLLQQEGLYAQLVSRQMDHSLGKQPISEPAVE